jgi:3-oxoacid CoA-transferase subunit A
MAGRITIAEVEELVEPGEIKPEHIHLPGVFVDRVVAVSSEGKKIEIRKTRPRSEQNAAPAAAGDEATTATTEGNRA